MDRTTKLLLAAVSICLVLGILLCLGLFGFDITGITIQKGFHLS